MNLRPRVELVSVLDKQKEGSSLACTYHGNVLCTTEQSTAEEGEEGAVHHARFASESGL
jgi:hypothetical protein